ncbi:energy transducer TonB [Dokdonia ponticola]|uniref:Energy transducer TonB n=1 Tax=Dokdonia ponticola TaxID=2041041 RepID=A0ABV9I0A8_9FLAO
MIAQKNIDNVPLTESCVIGYIPFDTVEKVPVYQGCTGKDNKELKNCFSNAVSKFITENLSLEIKSIENYPPGSIRMFLRFIINKEGYITDINVRAQNKSLENEAIRVIKKLPQMIPGKQKGKSVAVLYNFPMIFCVKE